MDGRRWIFVAQCPREMRCSERHREPHPRDVLRARLGEGGRRDHSRIGHAAEDPVAAGARRLRVPVWAKALRRTRDHDEQSALRRREASRLLAEIGKARRAHPLEIAAERRQSQIKAEHLVLAQHAFERQRPCHFAELCGERVRVAFEQPGHLHRQSRCAGHDTSVQRQLSRGAQRGERIDAGMPCEARVLSGDQHAPIERIDLLGLDRQPPFSVAAEKTTQDRSVRREDENRPVMPAVERRRLQHEVESCSCQGDCWA